MMHRDFPAHHDAWVWRAFRHLNRARTLRDQGLRDHPRCHAELIETRCALQCALFWAPNSPSIIALLDKIEDALTAPKKEPPCRS